MTITAKTRKRLWAHSGNRCAICKRELVMGATPDDEESVIGEECHIVSKQANGPRTYLTETDVQGDLDNYENLILLCGNHHKLVDDQPNQYGIMVLKKLKEEHERWVSEVLGNAISDESHGNNQYLIRVYSGHQLIQTMSGAEVTMYHYDRIESEDDTLLVAGFIEKITELLDFIDDMSPLDQAQTALDLDKDLQELHEHAYWLFTSRVSRKFTVAGEVEIDLACLCLAVAHNTDPEILTLRTQESCRGDKS